MLTLEAYNGTYPRSVITCVGKWVSELPPSYPIVSPVFLFAVPVLGLGVLGCGIAQFLKVRELKGAEPL